MGAVGGWSWKMKEKKVIRVNDRDYIYRVNGSWVVGLMGIGFVEEKKSLLDMGMGHEL